VPSKKMPSSFKKETVETIPIICRGNQAKKKLKGGLKEPTKYDDLQHQERTKQSV